MANGATNVLRLVVIRITSERFYELGNACSGSKHGQSFFFFSVAHQGYAYN